MDETFRNENLLYHYTSNKGLLGILKTGEIWMSDPRFLNDSQEWLYPGRIVAKTVARLAEVYKSAYLQRGCREDVFTQFVNNVVTRFMNLPMRPQPEYQEIPFIFSLSRDGDVLSQWRAYGKGEYCIAFDRKKLEQITGAKLVEIEYRDIGVDDGLKEEIAQFFWSHLEHIYTGGIMDGEVLMCGYLDLYARLNGRYLLSKKSPGFREEQEVRLVKKFHLSDQNIFLDDSQRYPVPRARIRIFDPPLAPKQNKQEKSASPDEVVKAVICGPGADRERVNASSDMLHANLRMSIRFLHSEIPFRAS